MFSSALWERSKGPQYSLKSPGKGLWLMFQYLFLPQAARQRFMVEDLFIHQLLVLELLSAGLSGDACCSYQLWECVVECCPHANFLT